MKPKCKQKWHLETRKFFKAIHAEWQFTDDEVSVIYATCEQLDLYWRACDQISDEGATFQQDNGMIRKHPAVEIVKNSWSGFLAGCRLLGVCQAQDDKKAPGRPPEPFGKLRSA
jgi:P27 family predicted phage terminase small subunit